MLQKNTIVCQCSYTSMDECVQFMPKIVFLILLNHPELILMKNIDWSWHWNIPEWQWEGQASRWKSLALLSFDYLSLCLINCDVFWRETERKISQMITVMYPWHSKNMTRRLKRDENISIVFSKMLKRFTKTDCWKETQGIEGFHLAVEELGTTWQKLNENGQDYNAPDSIWGQLLRWRKGKTKICLTSENSCTTRGIETARMCVQAFLVTNDSLNLLLIQTNRKIGLIIISPVT